MDSSVPSNTDGRPGQQDAIWDRIFERHGRPFLLSSNMWDGDHQGHPYLCTPLLCTLEHLILSLHFGRFFIQNQKGHQWSISRKGLPVVSSNWQLGEISHGPPNMVAFSHVLRPHSTSENPVPYEVHRLNCSSLWSDIFMTADTVQALVTTSTGLSKKRVINSIPEVAHQSLQPQ